MRSPGFEPGSSAWEADVLARLDYDRLSCKNNAENSVTDWTFIPYSENSRGENLYSLCYSRTGTLGSFEAWILVERYAVVIRKAPVIAANTYARFRMFSKLFD